MRFSLNLEVMLHEVLSLRTSAMFHEMPPPHLPLPCRIAKELFLLPPPTIVTSNLLIPPMTTVLPLQSQEMLLLSFHHIPSHHLVFFHTEDSGFPKQAAREEVAGMITMFKKLLDRDLNWIDIEGLRPNACTWDECI